MTNEERYNQVQKEKFIGEDSIAGRAHTGIFSTDNPYLENLKYAWNLRDESALYELAIKEEAKLADYYREREDKYADLQEQRAYDDPMAQVARERRAGINPDIAGTNGSVGAGSNATANMPSLATATENTSNFANPTDTTSQILNGISAVASLFTGLSSLGTTLINGATSLSMLPIQRKAGQLANELSEQINPYIIANTKKEGNLLDKQILGQDINNDRSRLSFLNDSLNLTNYLSQFIPDGTTDEDSANILSALGFNAEEVPRFQNLLKQRYTNPHFKAWYENSVAAQRQAENFNKVYTNSVIENSIELKKDLDVISNQLTIAQRQFENRVISFLNNDEYASEVADLTKQETNVTSQQLGVLSKQYSYQSKAIDFAEQQLEHDVDVFVSQVEYLKQAKQISQGIIDALSEKGTLNGFEQAVFDTEQQRILLYDQLGTEYLGNAQIMVQNAIANSYHVHENHLSQGGYSTFVGVGITPGFPNFVTDRLSFTEFSKGNITSDDIKVPFVDALKKAYIYRRSLPTNANGSLSNPTQP